MLISIAFRLPLIRVTLLLVESNLPNFEPDPVWFY